ncbi:unnamed protein product [Heligmosomoides polygyrus]|uniref:Uncharacterized protein n=1 Tax=Heligmosomoides polygyrus TaxID=6339 RepID=A0A183GGX3_HELPZ|nr:unnamed protein product [Heligmosomoides polygyrus]
MSKIIGLLERLADLWIVGKCKCFMQRSKSFTHVDCLQLEPWVLEELNVCAALRSAHYSAETLSQEDSMLYAENLDSLHGDAVGNRI